MTILGSLHPHILPIYHHHHHTQHPTTTLSSFPPPPQTYFVFQALNPKGANPNESTQHLRWGIIVKAKKSSPPSHRGAS